MISQQAISLLIEQYRSSGRLNALLLAPLNQADAIEDVAQQLRDRLHIDLAEGENLDVIGRVVVQPRPFAPEDPEDVFTFENPLDIGLGFSGIGRDDVGGRWIGLGIVEGDLLDDIRYRRLLRAKIIRNTTSCTLDDMSAYVNFVLNADSTIISGIGFVDVAINRPLSLYDRRLIEETFPLPAGVRLRIKAFSIAANPFGFAGKSSNTGFGGISVPQQGGGFVGLF